MAKKESAEKIKPIVYEMIVGAMFNNKESVRDQKMMRVCGEVTASNFMPNGQGFCAPLVYDAVRKSFAIGDRIRITHFCKNKDIKNTDESINFVASGAKYEVWDDTSEGWTCVYDKFERDGQKGT